MALVADIRVVSVPSTAETGERVNIRVSIKNLLDESVGIMVGGALEYGVIPYPQITFPSNQSTFPPGGYYYFDGYFNMPYYPPGKVIKIHAYSYWFGRLPGEYSDAWHYDDEMVKSITTVAPEVEVPHWHEIGTAIRRIVSVAPLVVEIPYWHEIGNAVSLDVKFVEVVVIEHWHEIGVAASISVVALPPIEEVPYWHEIGVAIRRVISVKEVLKKCAVDADCPPGYVCIDGKCVPEEEKKFPVGAALLIGGGAALALLAATKEKGVTT